jgi:hypothetical protein
LLFRTASAPELAKFAASDFGCAKGLCGVP